MASLQAPPLATQANCHLGGAPAFLTKELQRQGSLKACGQLKEMLLPTLPLLSPSLPFPSSLIRHQAPRTP